MNPKAVNNYLNRSSAPRANSVSSGDIRKQITYLDYFSGDLQDLLTQLFNPNPERRLGSLGAAQVKNHPWFKSIDWTVANKMALEPPFPPSKGEVHALDAVDIG